MSNSIGFSFLALLFTLSASGAEYARIRVVSSNLSTGNKQNYDNGEGLRILKGLHPEVILMQEFNYRSNGAHDLCEFVKEALTFEDANCAKDSADLLKKHYYRESEASDRANCRMAW